MNIYPFWLNNHVVVMGLLALQGKITFPLPEIFRWWRSHPTHTLTPVGAPFPPCMGIHFWTNGFCPFSVTNAFLCNSAMVGWGGSLHPTFLYNLCLMTHFLRSGWRCSFNQPTRRQILRSSLGAADRPTCEATSGSCWVGLSHPHPAEVFVSWVSNRVLFQQMHETLWCTTSSLMDAPMTSSRCRIGYWIFVADRSAKVRDPLPLLWDREWFQKRSREMISFFGGFWAQDPMMHDTGTMLR